MNPAFPIHGDEGVKPGTQGQPDSGRPLSAEHHAQIARAQQQRRTISRATKVAAFNAWSFSVFAGFSLVFALFSTTSLITAVVLAGLAYNEFRGRRQLKGLDPRGPRTLGINQALFCVAITLYCGLQITKALTGPGPYAQVIEQTPELATTLEPMQGLIETATLVTYALILVVGVTVQGATSWYYFTRKRWLDRYLQQTPDWIVELDQLQAESSAC